MLLWHMVMASFDTWLGHFWHPLLQPCAFVGMCLSEAAGLLTDEIKLDADVPHITLRKHPWRSLKTASSERDIPLVGSAYDAARMIIEQD